MTNYDIILDFYGDDLEAKFTPQIIKTFSDMMDAAREDEAGKWEAKLKEEEKRANYWISRCVAAEKCIEKCPCDPDITKEQIEAHRIWEAAKKNEKL